VRTRLLVFVIAPIVAVACTSTAQGSNGAGTVATTAPTSATSDANQPDTPGTEANEVSNLAVDTIPATPGTQDPTATGTILMIKLPVGDVTEAEAFYGAVFGATPVASMGANVHIVTFPGEGPGLVLLGGTNPSENKQGAFIMRVPDLQVAKASALAHGATEQGTFAGTPGGQNAKSVDLLDPWGNQIEILQLG